MMVRTLIDRALTETERPPADAVACLGPDAPRELILAAGLTAWRLAPDGEPAPNAHPGLGRRSRRFLARLLEPDFRPTGIVLTHATAEDAQLFAVLRELDRHGAGPSAPFAYVDLLPRSDAATLTYSRARIDQTRQWLEGLTRRNILAEDVAVAVTAERALKMRLATLFAARRDTAPRLSGVDALKLIAAVTRLPPAKADVLLSDVENALGEAPPLSGIRVLVTGSAHESPALYQAIEAAGAVVVGEDHAWGDPWLEEARALDGDPLAYIAGRPANPCWPSVAQSSRVRAQALAARAKALNVDRVIHLGIEGDEATPWDIKALRSALPATSAKLLTLADVDPDAPDLSMLTDAVGAFLPEGHPKELARAPSARPASSDGEAKQKSASQARSRKSLNCTAEFGAWQKDWFAGVRKAAADGPFAVVNADAPQEILRALDIPYVVNQWWASIVAAKQKAKDYGRVLQASDYPSRVEAYSAQGLAAALAVGEGDPPWGGLPRPDILALVAGSDPGPKIFEAWAQETGANLFVFDRSIESRIDLPIAWWDDLPHRWNETLEAERLDLMEAQIEVQIARLEILSGRTLDRGRLVEVMHLVNEQEDLYRRTRDLIARTHPAPVGVVDTMPATMVPQWHRGTTWARDAAQRFHDEVAARAESGEAACPGERIRLMWVGRGLWSDTGFYQRWEESHGAVFVWSMYLGLAADGYLRFFEGERDVVRALAARFVTMGDELRMPTWSGAWHVKEARLHGCHAAVAIDDADPLVLDALERAGIPVCRVALNNMGAGSDDLDQQISRFLDRLSI
jgi:benzoyl-CoA reductase/2-hydroxyglutaryl-CoA dehydratase subunit BcrC/BadD/HgdB